MGKPHASHKAMSDLDEAAELAILERKRFFDLALGEKLPDCFDASQPNLCRQVGGHCYYMAVLNFVDRAEPTLRKHGYNSATWEAMFTFARQLAACSTTDGQKRAILLEKRMRHARLCRRLPEPVQHIHRYYQLLYNARLERAGLPKAAMIKGMPEGGNSWALLEALFYETPLVVMHTENVAVVNEWALKQSGDSPWMLNMHLSKSISAKDSKRVTDAFVERVDVARAAAAACNRTLLGGVAMTDSSEGSGHTIAWNMCTDDDEPDHVSVVLFDSNYRRTGGTHALSPGMMFRSLSRYEHVQLLTDVIAIII